MSVFSSSFDWFDRYANRKAFGASAKDRDRADSSAEASELGEVMPIPQAEPTFDPFSWLLGVGPAQSAAIATPVVASTTDSLPAAGDVPADAIFASDWSVSSMFGAHTVMSPIGSPADQWLSGNEWHGAISSGTVDTSGQCNDVFSVGGEVLSLPT